MLQTLTNDTPTIETMTRRYNRSRRLQSIMTLRTYLRATLRSIMAGRID